jgi:hypothetical protein
LKKREALHKKKLEKKVSYDQKDEINYDHSNDLITRSNSNSFASHTISSAIKADYTQHDVKNKLNELNSSVQKTKIIKQSPDAKAYRLTHKRPFVVRRIEHELIARRPELHDVLHDGLVLTEKNPNKIYHGRSRSAASSSRQRSNSARGRRNYDPANYRSSRSLSPLLVLRPSLNENLARENYRHCSSRSRSDSRRRFNSTSPLRNPHVHVEVTQGQLPSSCEVCVDVDSRNNLTYSQFSNVSLKKMSNFRSGLLKRLSLVENFGICPE